MLQRLAAASVNSRDREMVEQNGLVAIFLGTTAIEAFTNIYFRVVADEPQYAHARQKVLRQLEQRGFPTVRKLTEWTEFAFGHGIDTSDERWLAFERLQAQRNSFVHFKSSHDTVALPSGVVIQGLVDMSGFAAINEATPKCTLRCVCGIVELVGACRGVPEERLPAFVHRWTGVAL